MAKFPRFKRTDKHQARVDRPVVITGNFELQYEDVIRRNRFVVITFALTGLLAFGAFLPAVVYKSTADSQRVTVEAESGKITNPAQVTIVKGDSAAGGDSYIEFGPEKCTSSANYGLDACTLKQ